MQTFAEKQNQPPELLSSDLARSHTVTPGLDRRADSILHLQRTIGNQAVQRMLQTHPEEVKTGLSGAASPHLGHDFGRIPLHRPVGGAIQTRLTINTPGDEHEQEADRVAEQVMRMPEPQLQRACACGGTCPKCQMEQPGHEDEHLQTQRVQASGAGETSAPPSVREVLGSSGQPLDAATRDYFEPRFGHDLSQVRIHSDTAAEQSARDVKALAYTAGSDIVFGAGRFAPGIQEGRRLLAHELTHVVQQTHMPPRLMRKDDPDPATTGQTKDTPPWLSPSFTGPLPGEPAPGYEMTRATYTDADREALRAALKKRDEDNHANVGYFLDVYVSAAVDICGRYATSEMTKAAKGAARLALFQKLLDIALSVVLAEVVTFGIGMFVTRLGARAVQVIGFIANKGIKLAGSHEASVRQQDILSDTLEKRQEALDQITQTLAKQVGSLTGDMVRNLGGDVGDLGYWLGSARLADLGRFRIPELFPRANPQAIRATVAGAIAGLAHEHYASHGLMQEAYLTGPGEEFTPGAVHHMDDNIIIIHLGLQANAANVRDVEFYSSSDVLSRELIGKASIGLLPTVPLFIVVDASAANDRLAAAALVKAARFGGDPSAIEIDQLLSDYPRSDRQMIIKRNNQRVLTASGGGLAEQIWLYRLATGDDQLQALVSELISQQQDEAESNQGATQGASRPQVSTAISVNELAATAKTNLPLSSLLGADKYIADYLASRVVQAPEDRFKRAYWTKDNRDRFWEGHLPYPVE